MKDMSKEWKIKRSNNLLFGIDPEEDEYPPLSTSSWSSTNSSTNSTDSERDSREVYVCTKCHRKLFFKSGVINHQLELKGCEALLQRNKIEACDCLFVEVTKWMRPFDEEVNQGSLCCPNCKDELGSWQLKARECACGRQMDPAFKILLAKVRLVEDSENQLPPKIEVVEEIKRPTSPTSPTSPTRKWSITNLTNRLSSSPPSNVNGKSKSEKPEKASDKSFFNLKKRSLTQ